MPSGRPTLPETIPQLGADAAEAVERFRQVVARFQAHEGPFYPSPVFGAMERETLTQLQLVHCSHHLGFFVAKGDSSLPGEKADVPTRCQSNHRESIA